MRSRKRARVLISREGRRSPLGSSPSLFGLRAHRQHSHGGIPFTASLPQRARLFYQNPRPLLLGSKDFRRKFFSPSSSCSGSLYPSRSCSEPVSAIDDPDVLAHDDQGYHLNDDKVVVRDGTDGGDNNNVPSNVPGDKADVPDVPGDTSLNERQTWIVAQIDKRAEVRRRAVEEKFGVSAKTAKRDFSELVKRGMVEYVSRPQPGFYRRR